MKIKRNASKYYKVFVEKEFKQLYPTGGKRDVFNGSARVHKLKKGEELKELALRRTVSNIGKATYNTPVSGKLGRTFRKT